ncbi:hypothetical protein [Azorhizobium sp. AG788]|uniref:hypothetical protein n=1 Tax=Azorhizobium sp. AG788 TaxID=2183897 RepID=UPI003139FFCD
MVKPETKDFFAGILAGRGRVEGVFADGALVAYGVLQTVLPTYDDPRPFIGAAPDAPVAKLAGASVATAFRGRGLQRALIAARVGLVYQTDILFATSAPANQPSWMNLLSEGFSIRALVPYYGGHLRYLMVRDGTELAPRDEKRIAPGDTEQQIACLATGWRGVAARPTSDGIRILYVFGGEDDRFSQGPGSPGN